MSSLITDWTCVPCTGRRVFNRWTTREVPLCIFLRNPSCFYGVSVCVLVLSCLWLFATPWTVVHQASLSIGFSRQEYWSGLLYPSPGGPPNPGVEPASHVSCINSFLLLAPPGKPAAAAKLLQSTLCDPIDGSPPGSPVPGILQARTLEWVAIFFSNAWKWKVEVKLLRPHGLQPTRLLHPWDFPGKSTGVGSHCFLRLGKPTIN